MKPSKAVHTISAAALVAQSIAGASANIMRVSGEGERSDSPLVVDYVAPMASTADSFATVTDILLSLPSRRFSVQVNSIPEWSSKYDKRFETLTQKEALDCITPDELKELDKLQELRRRCVAPATGEEILFRHELRKLDRDTIELAKRYTRFVTDGSYT